MGMKISKVAKGKRAKASVFSGRKEKTSSGLKKTDLVKSKSGKIVSKKMSLVAKKRHASTIGKWTAAVTKARKDCQQEDVIGRQEEARVDHRQVDCRSDQSPERLSARRCHWSPRRGTRRPSASGLPQ